MKVWIGIMGLPFVAGVAVGAAVLPANAESQWVLNNCNQQSSFSTTWRRVDARAYSSSAEGDGYDWGGACWNGDGADNTPNQDGYHNSEGEGADCSGFTYKSWAMKSDYGTARRYWPPLSNKLPEAHGPYTAQDFKFGTGAVDQLPNKNYGTTRRMDAFASTGHVGMIYTELSGGSDMIAEAKDQQAGMGIFQRSYRSDTSYSASERSVWDT